MKHSLFGACSLLLVAACGSVVVVDGEPSGDGGHGGGVLAATTAATTTVTAGETTGETTGSGPADGCSMSCGANDGSTCLCVQTCAPPAGYIKVACAPNEDGKIKCVCTLDGGNFSSPCYEINNAPCDFENGCCAKYISGK